MWTATEDQISWNYWFYKFIFFKESFKQAEIKTASLKSQSLWRLQEFLLIQN